jgi:hypothetical protein
LALDAWHNALISHTFLGGTFCTQMTERPIPSLWNAIRESFPQFTPEQCANFFTATGYEPE